MDIHDPPGKGVDSSSSVVPAPHTPQRTMEISKLTEQHLVNSFTCMENEGWCRLVDSFTLLKVAVTKTPELDKIMAAQCSKSNNQALARIQALNFDTLGPLTELLEMINKEEDEITSEPGGSRSGVCSYPSGQYISQMSMLCQSTQRVQ